MNSIKFSRPILRGLLETLPKTASSLPLIGLLGACLCAISLTSTAIWAISSRLTGLKILE